MKSGNSFCLNEQFIKNGEPVISAESRSFRYGDGCFETMKFINGDIALSHYHFERLFSSLYLLKFKLLPYFTHSFLSEQIKKLAEKNNHQKLARIRLTVFRGDGLLYDIENASTNFIIESVKINVENSKLNKNGLTTGLFKDARKTCDNFSHIKTSNFLPYVMAAIWAKENKLDDAFILNNFNRVADATIANIFIVKNGRIKTPALSEGCIAGVMRRHLIKCIQEENIAFEEAAIEAEELLEADEIFLTNCIRGIQWVKQFDKSNYKNQLANYLYEKFV